MMCSILIDGDRGGYSWHSKTCHMAVPVLDIRVETHTLAVGFGDLEAAKELILLTLPPPRSSQGSDNVQIS